MPARAEKKNRFIFIILCLLLSCHAKEGRMKNAIIEPYGAVIRTDTTIKEINLVFTAHDFNDGFDTIIKVLRKNGIRASFFLTGDFYRDPGNKNIIQVLIKDGHYLGPHSDRHLLYCSWEIRDSLLIDRDEFRKDLENNFIAMKTYGIPKTDAAYFLPAYEWYNRKIHEWVRDENMQLVNFTPGTSSNQDWTYPELGKAYINSDTIWNRIIRYESIHGMNGFILLIHPGTDPRRIDKFYYRLDDLIHYLLSCGYHFTRIDEH